MIYRIKLDDNDIYGTQPDLSLVSPSVSIELNSAGSSRFTMPKGHKYYDAPRILTSDVDIYENDNLIWFGRVLEINMSMNLDKEIICEGPLAFFNDSIQRPRKYDNTPIYVIFQDIITNHNNYTSQNRRFTIGRVNVQNINVSYEINYEKTKDILETLCLNSIGGYFFFRKEDGINYIDWLEDLEEESIQPVKFGLNIVDISKYINGSDLRTAILPLGQEIDGQRITITSVYGGSDFVDSDAVNTYGRILEVVEFDDIGRPDELLSAAQKWLSYQQFDPITIKCDAAELNYLDDAYPTFSVGQLIHVESTPHLIDTNLPLISIEINMDSAVKKISIGTPEKRELSEIYNGGTGNGYSGGGSSGGGGSGGGISYTAGQGIKIAGTTISVKLGKGLAFNSETGVIDVISSPTPSTKEVFSSGNMYSSISPISETLFGIGINYQDMAIIIDVLTDGEEYTSE